MRYTKAQEAPFATKIEAREASDRYLTTRLRASNIRLIADRVHDEFGDNPCQRLTLEDDNGDKLHLPCDGKQCPDCGPRKTATMEQQLKTMGQTIWVARTKDLEAINRGLERVKKQHQRNGLEYTYQIVGDPYLGWIITSDIQILPEQSKGYLREWIDRIKTEYQYGRRIRRSRALGRMSLVPLRVVGKQGTSAWKRFVESFENGRQAMERAVLEEREAFLSSIGLDEWMVWDEDGRTRDSVSYWRVQNER